MSSPRTALWLAVGLAAATRPSAAEPAAPLPDVTSVCPIRWTEPHQEIDGFGVSASFHQAENLRTLSAEDQQRVLDLLFSTERGAGFSIVRNIVGDGGEIGGGRIWGEVKNGPTPSIEPRAGVWNWTGDEGQIWFMREAARRGCTRFISTSWSPPAWMKTNGSVIDGGHLRPECYQAFADYLAAYVRGYKEHHGIDIYAISPQNEPDIATRYSSCEWTAAEFHTFLKEALIPTFRREQVPARVILGEQTVWTDALLQPSLADPETAAGIDIVAAHAYMGDNVSQAPLATRSGTLLAAARLGKRVWQTEVSEFDANDPRIGDALYWARLIHTHLVQANVSAWFYWWGIACYDNKGTLVYLDLDRKTWTTARRLYAIGNYARFVRPGARRVGAESSPAPEVYVTAFDDPAAGRHVIVAINANAAPCPLVFPQAARAGEAVATWRTADRENLAPGELRATPGGDIETILPGESVTTFVLAR